ncbi:MBL fold metallo-hydrolase [Streptomyces sp. BHT-5-2]|uniref:MBL fold metallo-hydrolase n=1 Tax=Streptomyces sp. BHT-5-2 TaxID=2866715 RepID=UPI001C8E1194|nr:MBL fold metallo-hydrolase [Streptomyces sp. BHT-5-2]QZL06395.1 MBL fold metallo-hydrolase [Streptomyces sp. BHT-5-2]
MDAQRTVDLGDGAFAVVNGDGGMGLSNSTVLVDDGRAVVIDTMLLPRMNARTREELRARNTTAELILNTHQHVDHMGGNGAFPGVRAVAPEGAAAALRRMAEDTAFLPRLMPAFAPELTDLELRLPEPVDPEALVLPHEARALVFENAHSIVDLAVWLPGQRLLVAGDLCFHGVTPLARHGSVAGWIGALDRLIDLEPSVVVPGHGEVTGPHVLHVLRDYLQRLWSAACRAVEEGATAADTAAVADNFDAGPVAEWGEPQRTSLNLRVALGELTGDPLPLGPPR